MTEVVVDASAAIRAVLAEEPGHDDAHAVLAKLLAAGASTLAPDLYLYETGHVLARGGPKAERARALAAVHALVDLRRPSPAAVERAFALASDGKLSFYDAAYLALAEETDATLWTEDKELLKRFPGRTASTSELLRKLGS